MLRLSKDYQAPVGMKVDETWTYDESVGVYDPPRFDVAYVSPEEADRISLHGDGAVEPGAARAVNYQAAANQ